MAAPKIDLTPEEHAELTEGFNKIQAVLRRKNVNIAHVIGLVATDEVSSAAKQVDVKFAEETAAQMNMIAFD